MNKLGQDVMDGLHLRLPGSEVRYAVAPVFSLDPKLLGITCRLLQTVSNCGVL